VSKPSSVVAGAVSAGHEAPPAAVPLHDKLVWSLADIAALIGVSRRLLEKELSAGRMPRCDLRIGRRCLWRPRTIREWIEGKRP
jgi:hypothetical protein